ncbi:hypothetical protein EDWATA_01030 [Edwardsiella tarda ATCC 23685]|uniref:Uncharacterized protein n=1 Tax=Edwardsiella tarda ATCC 23685 TaxID=500638 RepID=D4F2S9_EDWTA|nr:hypothetical protein EDWATA_01030 [Edwardsiella tarda ATCC 23685]
MQIMHYVPRDRPRLARVWLRATDQEGEERTENKIILMAQGDEWIALSRGSFYTQKRPIHHPYRGVCHGY